MSDTPRTSALRAKHYHMTGESSEHAVRKAYVEMADLAADLERLLRLAGPARLELPSQLWLAQWFHDTYERLAPEYGYVTRNETRVFDPFSPNGKLMIAVCKQLREALDVSHATPRPISEEKS